MTSGPKIWNIGESIPIEIFVLNPSDSSGLTGQVANITFTIQRFSNNQYWTGSAWSVTLTPLTVTEVDETNQKGRYTYTLSAAANAQADKYIAHTIVDNAPLIDGAEDYELHVSRDLEVRIYESNPG